MAANPKKVSESHRLLLSCDEDEEFEAAVGDIQLDSSEEEDMVNTRLDQY